MTTSAASAAGPVPAPNEKIKLLRMLQAGNDFSEIKGLLLPTEEWCKANLLPMSLSAGNMKVVAHCATQGWHTHVSIRDLCVASIMTTPLPNEAPWEWLVSTVLQSGPAAAREEAVTVVSELLSSGAAHMLQQVAPAKAAKLAAFVGKKTRK